MDLSIAAAPDSRLRNRLAVARVRQGPTVQAFLTSRRAVAVCWVRPGPESCRSDTGRNAAGSVVTPGPGLRCRYVTRGHIHALWTGLSPAPPPQVPEDRIKRRKDGMVEVSLSGPHMVTLLKVTHRRFFLTPADDRVVSARVYEQDAKVIDAIDPNADPGQPIPRSCWTIGWATPPSRHDAGCYSSALAGTRWRCTRAVRAHRRAVADLQRAELLSRPRPGTHE